MVATYYLYYPSSEEFSLKCEFVYTRLWVWTCMILNFPVRLRKRVGNNLWVWRKTCLTYWHDNINSVFLGRFVFCVVFTQVTPVDRKNYIFMRVCSVSRIYYTKKYHHIFVPVEASADDVVALAHLSIVIHKNEIISTKGNRSHI